MDLAHIDIEITKKCNLSCIHCSAQANKEGDELSQGEIKTILTNAASLGLNNVGFTGGEPFCNKTKLRSLLEYCKKSLKTRTHMHTNGTLLEASDLDWLNQFLDELTVPIFGYNPRTHDEITSVKGSHEATLKGLRTLSNNHDNVKIFIVPMKRNFREIPDIIEEVNKLGYEDIRILSLSPTGNALNDYSSLALDKDERNWLATSLREINQERKVNILAGFCTRLSYPNLEKLHGHDSCLAAKNRVHIDAFGDVYPCTASSGWDTLSAGNLRKFNYDIFKMWNQSPYFQFFRHFHQNPPTKCQSCGNYLDCMGGCRVVEYHKQGDIAAIRQDCIPVDLKHD